MKVLSYLIFTQIKNRILSLKKKPALLIFYIIIFLYVIGSIVTLLFFGKAQESKPNADDRVLFLFICGFGLLYLYTFIVSGLSTGSSLFSMADVGLLFVAPISNKKILFYGLISTIGKTIFASIFIIYQVPNLKKSFDYSTIEVLGLFFIYIVMIVFCQIFSIGIYLFSNGNQARKNLVKTLLYGFFGVLAFSVYMIIQDRQVDILEAAKILVDSKWFGYAPVAGWSIMFFKGLLEGTVMQIAISLILFIGFSVLIISLLTAHDADYYEDVLYSTEKTFQMQKDYKEGRNLSGTVNRKIKIKDNENGIGKGKGASVFAYKHMLEMKRVSRFVFIDSATVFFAAGAAIAGHYIKEDVYGYIVLSVLVYLQFFTTVLGRLKIELIKPFIYLVPESSFKKLIAASFTSLIKPCIDGFIIFGAFALTGGASLPQCFLMALAYSSTGAVFVGLTIVYQRVLGGQPSKILQALISMILFIAIFTPSIAATVLVSIFILPDSLKFLTLLPFVIVNYICAFIIFYSCRNLLDNTEYSEGMSLPVR